MDKIYEQTMLFDFYGELLTEHQRSVYEDAVYRDMSLGEIAEERGISRQGVHDLIKRCDRILQEYESKLHLVERFAKAKKTVAEIERLTFCTECLEEADGETGEMAGKGADKKSGGMETPQVAGAQKMQTRLQAIRRLSHELLEEL